MTQARFNLDPYTTRVLDVVKGKFGLKNREEALQKFVQQHGEEYAEMHIDEKILIDLDKTYNDHMKKYGMQKMNDEELNNLLGL